MPKIKYKPSNFPLSSHSSLLTAQYLTISKVELFWGCVTVGKFGLACLNYFGIRSIHEILFKWHLLNANLIIDNNKFAKTSLYEDLDPTEKAVVSYYLGMACTKVFADKLLNTPWIFHVSKAKPGAITYKPGNSKPDLIGQDNIGNWVVIEAKGRTNGYCSKTMLAAKKQTLQINKINGITPTLRVAFQSYFNHNQHLQVAVEDPPEADENAIDLNFDEYIVIREYYENLIDLMSEGAIVINSDRGRIRVKKLPEIGLEVGLLENIVEAWYSENKIDLINIRDKLRVSALNNKDRNTLNVMQDANEYFFNDGVYISTHD